MRAQRQDETRDEQRAQYLRAIFDAFPVAAFVVDNDVRIQDFNTTAEQLLGPEPAMALHRRGGEALHCIHAETNGCGKAEFCCDCIIRNGVNRAFATQETHRERHHAKLRTKKGVTAIDLLVTVSLLPYTEEPRALLILENAPPIRSRLKASV